MNFWKNKIENKINFDKIIAYWIKEKQRNEKVKLQINQIKNQLLKNKFYLFIKKKIDEKIKKWEIKKINNELNDNFYKNKTYFWKLLCNWDFIEYSNYILPKNIISSSIRWINILDYPFNKVVKDYCYKNIKVQFSWKQYKVKYIYCWITKDWIVIVSDWFLYDIAKWKKNILKKIKYAFQKINNLYWNYIKIYEKYNLPFNDIKLNKYEKNIYNLILKNKKFLYSFLKLKEKEINIINDYFFKYLEKKWKKPWEWISSFPYSSFNFLIELLKDNKKIKKIFNECYVITHKNNLNSQEFEKLRICVNL